MCLATGCANQAVVQQCLAEDWYERGYTDATKGLSTHQFLNYHYTCAPRGVTPHRSDYLSGWVAGRDRADPT